MRILCIQHVRFEGPAAIADWAEQRGHEIKISHLYKGSGLPNQHDFDWLLVMGGPMGVHDERDYPWLKQEKAFLRQTVEAGKLVIGICLGAQLIAHVLGAKVYPGPEKEIGWFSIEFSDTAVALPIFDRISKRLDVFHWHGDTFDLPSGALHLASSPGCANQAFLYDGRVLGLQFHMESTPASVRAIIDNCGDELVTAPFIQSEARMLSAGLEAFDAIHVALYEVLDGLTGYQGR